MKLCLPGLVWQIVLQCPSWEKVPDSIDRWLDQPISLATWLCGFISFSLEKLLSPVTTDTGRVSRIRKSADLFEKHFNRLCLWRKCKYYRGSLSRNYTQSSSGANNFVREVPVNDVVSHWRHLESDCSFCLFHNSCKLIKPKAPAKSQQVCFRGGMTSSVSFWLRHWHRVPLRQYLSYV